MNDNSSAIGCKCNASKKTLDWPVVMSGSCMSLGCSINTLQDQHSHAIIADDLLGRRLSPSGILKFDKVKQSKEEVFVQLDSHGLEQDGSILDVEYTVR